MNKTAWTVASVVLAVLLLAFTLVSKLMGGCTTMVECTSGFLPMKCHWTYIAVFSIGIAGTICAVAAIFQKTLAGRRAWALAAGLALLTAICVISPLGIGTCSHADSQCNSTAIVEYLLGGIGIVVSLVMAALADPDWASKPKNTL